MPKLKCIFCGKLTMEKEVNIEKKSEGRIIAIKSAIINYCIKCDEKFYSSELTGVIKYAIEKMSKNRPIILYEDALYEYQKTCSKENISEQFKKITKNAIPDEDKKEVFILQDVFNGGYYRNCIRAIEEKVSSEAIKIDLIVMVYHHSNRKPLKAVINKCNNGNCSLRLSSELAIISFLVGEPFVLKFSKNGLGYNIGCVVNNVNKQNELIHFTVTNLHDGREKRRSDRIPVSIYSEICRLGNRIRYDCIIKDLSKHGFLICSKEMFEEGAAIEIYIHTSFKVICLFGAIVREKICEHNNEYGIEIVKVNQNDLFFFKKHMMCL